MASMTSHISWMDLAGPTRKQRKETHQDGYRPDRSCQRSSTGDRCNIERRHTCAIRSMFRPDIHRQAVPAVHQQGLGYAPLDSGSPRLCGAASLAQAIAVPSRPRASQSPQTPLESVSAGVLCIQGTEALGQEVQALCLPRRETLGRAISHRALRERRQLLRRTSRRIRGDRTSLVATTESSRRSCSPTHGRREGILGLG